MPSPATKILAALRRTRDASAMEAPPAALVSNVPPFFALEAAMATRVRTWRAMCLVLALALGGVIIGQQWLLSHELFARTNQEIIVVPGSPEFFRVRPGQIPDESVFLFAEYVAENLGSFSYRSARYHFQKIMGHMTPTAKARFEALFEQQVSDWLDRRVDQTFAYEPVRQYDIVNDERGPKYVVVVKGTRVRYVEGRSFSESREVLALEFRSRGNLTPDRPFIFELENIEWMTVAQFQASELSKAPRSRVTKQGDEKP